MAITDLVAVPSDINQGVTSARQATMLSLLGAPRGSYDQECREVTNPTLRRLMKLDSVGPFRVTGLGPAVDLLKTVMADIREAEREIHDGLGSAGMVCARNVRGSSSSISNHSWGTAIDVTLDGILDRRGDDKVQVGLTRIAPIFNRHGWFWGAGFRTEDAMHFEVSDQTIRAWHAQGLFGDAAGTPADDAFGFGDRGPEVWRLQERLNELGAGVDVDGIFGSGTRAAVVAFQARHNLPPTGMVDSRTATALGLA